MKQTYWYLTIIDYCPLCGSETKSRIRVGAKPKKSIIMHNTYDYCDNYYCDN